MSSLTLEIGEAVKYLAADGEWKHGVVQGIKTLETPEGVVTKQSYLVDTGGSVYELPTKFTKKGKPTDYFRQPETIECTPQQIKKA